MAAAQQTSQGTSPPATTAPSITTTVPWPEHVTPGAEAQTQQAAPAPGQPQAQQQANSSAAMAPNLPAQYQGMPGFAPHAGMQVQTSYLLSNLTLQASTEVS